MKKWYFKLIVCNDGCWWWWWRGWWYNYRNWWNCWNYSKRSRRVDYTEQSIGIYLSFWADAGRVLGSDVCCCWSCVIIARKNLFWRTKTPARKKLLRFRFSLMLCTSFGLLVSNAEKDNCFLNELFVLSKFSIGRLSFVDVVGRERVWSACCFRSSNSCFFSSSKDMYFSRRDVRLFIDVRRKFSKASISSFTNWKNIE